MISNVFCRHHYYRHHRQSRHHEVVLLPTIIFYTFCIQYYNHYTAYIIKLS